MQAARPNLPSKHGPNWPQLSSAVVGLVQTVYILRRGLFMLPLLGPRILFLRSFDDYGTRWGGAGECCAIFS